MAKSTLERARKFRATEKGKQSVKSWNSKVRGTPMRRAAYQVGWLTKTGQIPRANTLICVDCGAQAEVYDHRDYLKPKDVEPVCRKCNYKRGPGKNK